MPTSTSTSTSGTGVVTDPLTLHSPRAGAQVRYLQRAARRAYRSTITSPVLEPIYQLNILPTSSWLPTVEKRIENSVLPMEYEAVVADQGEWLREDVGRSAIRFFQHTADILPSEPFIYASQTGALVAEFSAVGGALTTIISPTSIILFATSNTTPNTPVETTLKSGTNRLREEVKDVVHSLMVAHGQMGPAR